MFDVGAKNDHASDMTDTVSAQARLRERNQLTIPDLVVQAAGIGPGVTFIVETTLDDPDTLVLRRVRASYAGALRGVYGPVVDYVEGERDSWE
jgi:hypothetical protein